MGSREPLSVGIIQDFSVMGQDVFLGVWDYAQNVGGWSLVFGAPSSPESWASLGGQRLAGVIVHGSDAEMLAELDRRGLVWVNVSTRIEPLPQPTVTIDNRAVGRLAGAYLRDLHHRSYAFVGMDGMPFSEQRGEGFIEDIEAAGRASPEVHLIPVVGKYAEGETDWKQASRALRQWLRQLPVPTAIFCANDEVATEVISAAVQAGRSIPGDFALLGCDNQVALCEAGPVTLSSIRSPFRQIGESAARLLNQRLEGEPGTGQAVIRMAPLGVVPRRSTEMTAVDNPILKKALRIIAERARGGLNVSELAEATGASRRYLERHFQAELGRTPKEEILRQRVSAAERFLTETDLSLATIAEISGFGEVRALTRAFRRIHNQSPVAFRLPFKPHLSD